MTHIYADRDRLHLTADGHAGQAAAGHDVVCAAISTLIQTLAQRASDLGVLDCYHTLDGKAVVDIEPGADAIQVFETILTGLWALAEQYPQYVDLTIDGGAHKWQLK